MKKNEMDLDKHKNLFVRSENKNILHYLLRLLMGGFIFKLLIKFYGQMIIFSPNFSARQLNIYANKMLLERYIPCHIFVA